MKKLSLLILDLALVPLTLFTSIYMLLMRKYFIGFFRTRLRWNLSLLRFVGIFPIRNHYYEPWFGKIESRTLKLTGVNFNVEGQLALCKDLTYAHELTELANEKSGLTTYNFNDGPFGSGDAEILYSVIRHFKPNKIVEVGGGHSSKIIQHALNANSSGQNAKAEHICIEPFEAPYLKLLDLTLIRKLVTDVDPAYFVELDENDILFIDSSHVIRPNGDVLFQILQIMPLLKPGVIIHIHDIFSPNEYLPSWHNDGVNFWNEQYLLEAFLSCNDKFEIICAVNYLKHEYFDELKKVCPMLDCLREPGSMWIRVIK